MVVVLDRGFRLGVPSMLLHGAHIAAVGIERGRDARVAKTMRPRFDPDVMAEFRDHVIEAATGYALASR